MLSSLWAIITLINNLWEMWKRFLDARDVARSAEAERKRQEREKAVEGAANAESDEDIFKHQEDVVKNLP